MSKVKPERDSVDRCKVNTCSAAWARSNWKSVRLSPTYQLDFCCSDWIELNVNYERERKRKKEKKEKKTDKRRQFPLITHCFYSIMRWLFSIRNGAEGVQVPSQRVWRICQCISLQRLLCTRRQRFKCLLCYAYKARKCSIGLIASDWLRNRMTR